MYKIDLDIKLLNAAVKVAEWRIYGKSGEVWVLIGM